jgi:hypothetical protein
MDDADLLYSVTLRPSMADEMFAPDLPGPDAMDAWLQTNGRTGDHFNYACRSANAVAVGVTGVGIIDDQGEAAYRLSQ